MDVHIAPTDPGIRYSPYNWHVTPHLATSWNPGSYFATLFYGGRCVLEFDVSWNGIPLSQIWWRVDNGPWIAAEIASTIECTIPDVTAHNPNVPWHAIEVWFKSTDTGVPLNRWNTPSATAIRFSGLTLDEGGLLAKPGGPSRNILIFGDSLAEGVRTLGEAAASTPDNNDGMFTWCAALRSLLAAEVGVVGLGGTGYTARFANCPVFGTSYAFLADGVPRQFTPRPDLIIINHGANDLEANIRAQAVAVVDDLSRRCPGTPILLLGPFPFGTNAFLEQVPADSGAPTQVHFVDTTGFFTTRYGADSLALHPSGPNSVHVIAPQVAAAISQWLAGPAASS